MEKLKLRLKVYTDREGLRWLVPSAQFHTKGGYLEAIGMRDGAEAPRSVRTFNFTPAQWNALPFYWFSELEAAKERPVDIIPREVFL